VGKSFYPEEQIPEKRVKYSITLTLLILIQSIQILVKNVLERNDPAHFTLIGQKVVYKLLVKKPTSS
jgi:hypothetical protein